MDDAVIDDLVALLPPLLKAMTALEFIARHLDPMDVEGVLARVGTPQADLKAAADRLRPWPEPMADTRSLLDTATGSALAAFDGIMTAAADGPDMRALYRALRHLPRSAEALYPLAAHLPIVGRHFLDPAKHDDANLAAALARVPAEDSRTGVIHVGDPPGSRGSVSLYIPENYSPDRAWPVVFALHGGAGNGRAFLWSWLREARSFGAILVAPTAIGQTWALMGDDIDSPNLGRILDLLRQHWTIDERRLLLTGMSDGGTFSYVCGLVSGSPFTHLAPVAAAFHPMLAEMVEPDRMRGLPIAVTHGARDWMFPVEMARNAQQALRMAGADVTYREIADLSHTYPREINADLLRWLDGRSDPTASAAPAPT